MTDQTADAIAEQIMAAMKSRQPLAPFTQLDLETSYAVSARIRALREAHGERVIGRKIGFTNRTIWDEYGVKAPMWGYMYDTSLHDLDRPFDLSPFLEPRIEPEICFGLGRTPSPDMEESDLLGCIDWVAHGFEIVHSLFPGWQFRLPDTVAAFGLHGALLLGPREPVSAFSGFEITLESDKGIVESGHTANVLGSPLSALRHILAIDPALEAGEMITTGTLTRAVAIAAGETWKTTIQGCDIDGIEASFV